MLVSVCIPAYEMHGEGVKMLSQLMKSVEQQVYPDIEVIISDHSSDKRIENLIKSIKKTFKYPVIYLRNMKKKGNSSANLNNAIMHASGSIIKPMFQDDLFIDPRAVSKMLSKIRGNTSWSVCASQHYSEKKDERLRVHRPGYTSVKKMSEGFNTFGAPSAVMFRKHGLLFDEKLIWLMDCEFYGRYMRCYGRPALIKEPLISVRLWEGSVTNTDATEKVRSAEKEYVTRSLDKGKNSNIFKRFFK